MADKDPIRVGILYSETGVTSTIGLSQLQGALLGIEEINAAGGIDGRELVAVRHDPQSNPARYAQLAEKLIVQDRVNVIFGCYMSSSRKAVIPVIEKWNKLLFYPTLYEGFEYSGNVIYTGAAPNQNSVQLAEFMTTNFGARVYLIGSDYIYPYESNRIMGELVMQRPGSEKLGEHYAALDATEKDYRAIMADIRDKQPDFIFSTVVGDSTASLYRAYAEAGFDPKRMPIASLTTSEAEISQMGRGVATGHFTAAPYFQSIDSPANQRCLAQLRALRRRLRTQSVLGSGLLPDAHLRQCLRAGGQRRHRGDPAAHPRGRVRCAAGAGEDRPVEPPHLSLSAHRACGCAGAVHHRSAGDACRVSRSVSGDAFARGLDCAARYAGGLGWNVLSTVVRGLTPTGYSPPRMSPGLRPPP